ncbi:WcaI family glycosyltransferase [Spirosoma areae]
MRILLYTANFSPELTGSGKYNGELAHWLAQRGHCVDVITTPPHYPQWQVQKPYSGLKWTIERSINLIVRRSPIYVPRIVTGKTRMLFEISFAISSIPYWFGAMFRQYDVIFCVCPPLQIGIYPWLYRFLKKTPFLFHVHDLQVDAARKLNMITNDYLLSCLEKFETFLLKNADCVSSISEGMKQNILNKGVSSDQYIMLDNWVDTEHIRPLPLEESFRDKYGFSYSAQIVLYSGNMGEKQGLEVVLQAAKQLVDNSSIQFVLSGDGSFRTELQRKAAHLTNLHFLPLQPYSEFPKLLAMANVHLIIQKRAAGDIVMPSKLTSVLSAGGVAIVSAENHTSLANAINRNNIGYTVDPEDGVALAEVIRKVLCLEDLTNTRLRARSYAIKHFSKEVVLKKYEDTLRKISKLS